MRDESRPLRYSSDQIESSLVHCVDYAEPPVRTNTTPSRFHPNTWWVE